MKRTVLFLAILFAVPAGASISVVNAKQNCTASPCTVSSTTANHLFLIGTDSSTLPTAANVILDNGAGGNSQTGTKVGCELRSTVTSNICGWIIASLTGTQTRLRCNSCGTINSLVGLELSGHDATNYLDAFVACYGAIGNPPCNNGSTGSTIGTVFVPGWSNEFVFYMGNCAGSATTVTGTGVSLTTQINNGEPNGQGIISGSGQITATSNCNQFTAGSFIIGIKPSGATQNLTSNLAYQGYSTVHTSGSATVTAYSAQAGDLMLIDAWCITSCTVSTLTYGSQSATCPGTAEGVSDANTGMTFQCYILSTTSAGSATLTFTPGGSPTQFQVSYSDFVPSSQQTISHDTDAFNHCASACSEGTTVATPSITPTTGDLLYNFVYTQHHVTGIAGSWNCYQYIGSGDSDACQTVTTVNQASWILSASAGSTAADTTILNSNDPFQSIISAFKYTSTIVASTCSDSMTLLGVGCK